MATHTIKFDGADIQSEAVTTTQLTMNTVPISVKFSLQNVTTTGNTTTEVVQFTNPTTGLVTTSNVIVGGGLEVGGELDATAIGNNLIDIIYPVGSIYFTASAVSPSTSIGGSWVRYAQGKCLFGVDDADTDFALETTGGEKEHTLTVAEMPSHTHTLDDNYRQLTQNGAIYHNDFNKVYTATTPGSAVDTTSATGGDQPHENLPPYIAIYIWKRTA